MKKAQNEFQSYLIMAILFFLPVYLMKIKFGWVAFNLLELLIAFLFIAWIVSKEKKIPAIPAGYIFPALLIFAGLVFSVIVNGNYYAGFGAIKGWFFFPIIFAIIFLDELAKNKEMIEKSFAAIFLSGVAVSLAGLIFKITERVTYDWRLAAFWSSPNQLAMYLAAPFLVGVYFAKFENKNSKPNYFVYFGLMLIILNLYFTKSYGAWLALGISLFIWLAFEFGKKIKTKNAFLAGLTIIVLVIWMGASKFQVVQEMGDRSSLASRLMIWKSAGMMIKENSFFGIGAGNFQEKYLEYKKYFPPYLEWSVPQPHNTFLAFWLESGILGLTGFVWIVILFFRDIKISIRENRDLGILSLAIMAYIFIHGLVDTTYWRNDLAIIFWMVVAVNLFLSKKSKDDFSI